MSYNEILNGSTTVTQILQNLTFGELSQYAVGNAAGGIVAEAEIPKVMSAINRGVNQLQLDMGLHENTVIIRLREGTHTYLLDSKHSMITGTESVLYIDDSVDQPFEDDVLRIRQIMNKYGQPHPINVKDDVNTLYTPTHKTIQNPFAVEDEVMAVVYTRFTKPQEISTYVEADVTYLPLPDYMLHALYQYVASRMTAGITTQQEISDSQVWMQEYTKSVAAMKFDPQLAAQEHTNTKLHDRGYV